MTGKDELKQFKDPLLGDIDSFRSHRSTTRSAQKEESQTHPGWHGMLLLGVALATAVGILGYFLYDAQRRVESLSSELTSSQETIKAVHEDLKGSQSKIEELDQELADSRSQISSQDQELGRYKNIVQGLKSEQEQQTQEIRSLNAVKADQQEVVKIRQESTAIKEQVATTSTRIDQAQQEISRLDTVSKDHSAVLARHDSDIEGVRSSSAKNSSDISELRRSLEREYYSFELQEGGGYLKVFDVSLSLKDTDFEKRQYDLYVMAGGKVLRKKDQSVNEPILFYLEGKTKPYEVVVTRIDKKLVVGYLSVPKS